ncbi:MAG: hypothetical protein ACRD43_03235 [Pyrinomonadaceae bacterium]
MKPKSDRYKIMVLIFFASTVFFAACAAKKGEPLELSKVCDPGNDGKYLEVKGVIAEPTSVFCSNIGGGRMECPFELSDAPGGEPKMRVEIEEGSGANTVDKIPSGYKKGDIKIHDNTGSQVMIGSDVMRLTGKTSISPDAKACFMEVDKIEK